MIIIWLDWWKKERVWWNIFKLKTSLQWGLILGCCTMCASMTFGYIYPCFSSGITFASLCALSICLSGSPKLCLLIWHYWYHGLHEKYTDKVKKTVREKRCFVKKTVWTKSGKKVFRQKTRVDKVREKGYLVREKSGKSQGICLCKFGGHPARSKN